MKRRSPTREQRQAFGHPIADFQAIQFMLADMATEIDAARLLARRAAWKQDSGARFYDGSRHRQTFRQRNGHARGAQSDSDSRRQRLQPRISGRARLSRRAHHRNLRRHQRNPAPGDRRVGFARVTSFRSIVFFPRASARQFRAEFDAAREREFFAALPAASGRAAASKCASERRSPISRGRPIFGVPPNVCCACRKQSRSGSILREVAARIRYRATGSKFEQTLALYQHAREHFPAALPRFVAPAPAGAY